MSRCHQCQAQNPQLIDHPCSYETWIPIVSFCIHVWDVNFYKYHDVIAHVMTHPQTPWKIQMWVPKWKQKKKKELGYLPLFTTLWRGKRGIFSAWTNHNHTLTHKTHHNLNLGESTTFPLTLFFVICRGDYTQMSFFPRFPSRKFQNSRNWDARHFWRP
jgi:hypothetical protein